jgi:GTPase SAR1 family protein
MKTGIGYLTVAIFCMLLMLIIATFETKNQNQKNQNKDSIITILKKENDSMRLVIIGKDIEIKKWRRAAIRYPD